MILTNLFISLGLIITPCSLAASNSFISDTPLRATDNLVYVYDGQYTNLNGKSFEHDTTLGNWAISRGMTDSTSFWNVNIYIRVAGSVSSSFIEDMPETFNFYYNVDPLNSINLQPNAQTYAISSRSTYGSEYGWDFYLGFNTIFYPVASSLSYSEVTVDSSLELNFDFSADNLSGLELEIYQYRFTFYSAYSDIAYDYEQGYNDGYRDGLKDNNNLGTGQEHYDEGYNAGYNDGYNDGASSGSTAFLGSAILAFFDVPLMYISKFLNFEFFGINLLGVLTAVITLGIIILIIKTLLGGGGSK